MPTDEKAVSQGELSKRTGRLVTARARRRRADFQSVLAPEVAMVLREHSGEATDPRLGSIPG